MANRAKTATKNIDYGRRVGANVRALRKVRKLTQNEVAAASGLSRATVAGLEGGKYESVELSTIGALAHALGVGEEDLIKAAAPDEGSELANFRSSPWFAVLQPTAEEMAWLARLPSTFWRPGWAPSPKAFFELIELRRRSS